MIEQPVPRTTLDRLIVEQARRTPDAPAVIQWDDRLTYRDLVSRAGALAAVLRGRGVGPEVRVGVCAARTPAMVVAALGVLMAGGCYVPLDPAHPETRRRDTAGDAGAGLVVGVGPDAIPVPQRGDGAALETPSTAGPDNLAHVLFTSGSTGRPKGVLTTHRNIVDFVTSCVQFSGAGPETRSLGIASLGFDAATIDYWTPLTVGGSVQLLGERDRDDPVRLHRFIAGHRVNWGFITPSVLSLLDPDELPQWRLVMCGGEAVPAWLARRWATPGRQIWNAYGPTEATVLAVACELTGRDEQTVPLGRPLPGHAVHIVDGELLIGGTGPARGYLNRPGLTAARFVPDPFSATPGARLYRTGDLARIREDGQIEYLGRDDGQIKVNGQRIETGEIEAVLAEQAGVGQAAVVALEGASGTEVVAFVTPVDAPDGLLAGAAERLTSAMMPSRLLRLPELPRGASGKLDRGRLRELASQDHDDDGPLSGEARTVAEIWWRLLGRRPGPGTHFTAVGGDSISAMRMVAALRKEFGRDVSVEDVFTGRTPDGIAAQVAKAEPLTGRELTTGHPPTLSPPQRRLWFSGQLAPEQAPYNIPLAERIRGPLDVARLRTALTAVADRHEILRWRVLEKAGAPYAVCHPEGDVPLVEVVLAGASGVADGTAEAELHARLAADARTPFNLAGAPPWRATLYQIAPDDHVLALTFHHIAFDGWSQRLLYHDLARSYQGLALAERAASYADYAAWRERRDHLRAGADVEWWLEHLRGAPSVVELPRDHPRPAVATYRGAQVSINIPAGADAAVRRLAAELGTTPACVLLAGFGQILRRTTGVPDAVIGAVVADRRLAEFDDQVGFFIDMVPVRLPVEDTAPFAEHVRRAAAELLDVAAHPSAPVEVLVDKLGLPRDTSRAPLVQIMFNVLNFADPVLDLPGLRTKTIVLDKPGSPFDMTVYVLERDGRLAVELLYNPDLFTCERVTALLADYATLLGAFAEAPWARVADVAAGLPKAIPTPPGAMTVRVCEEPADGAAAAAADVEAAVAAVWTEVLGREAIAPTSNFFDVGGTSLTLTAVRARLSAQFGRQLKIVDLFRHPTIRSLAAFLRRAAGDPHDPAPGLDQVHDRVAARRERAARRGSRRPGGPGTTPDRRGD
jgi:mycobactin peptide synthetase MbtE